MYDKGVMAICILFVAALIAGLWVIAVNNVPDCQTMSNAHYTGVQTIDGHRVECFHGNVVEVR